MIGSYQKGIVTYISKVLSSQNRTGDVDLTVYDRNITPNWLWDYGQSLIRLIYKAQSEPPLSLRKNSSGKRKILKDLLRRSEKEAAGREVFLPAQRSQITLRFISFLQGMTYNLSKRYLAVRDAEGQEYADQFLNDELARLLTIDGETPESIAANDIISSDPLEWEVEETEGLTVEKMVSYLQKQGTPSRNKMARIIPDELHS